jgi:uncharacterized protein (DUF1015 family)
VPGFRAFQGHRYDSEIAPLAETIAPPYDVVSPTEREMLAERSPYNAIHVELPIPNDAARLNRYENAAAIFSAWEHEGAIRRDDVATLYVYRMTFVTETGEHRTTTGVIGAMELDVPGGTAVLPHERTMPKPKGDRLELLRACKANLSPIWGLSLAPGIAACCNAAIEGLTAPMSATDEEAITHELWPIIDQAVIDEITSLVSSTPIVIADGHHRYETAIFYQQEQRQQNGDVEGDYDAVMTLIVELHTDELFVLPIHRLITGLPVDIDLISLLEPFFEVRAGPSDVDELANSLESVGALGLLSKDGNYLLIPLPELDEASEANLDSSRLDTVLFALPAHELTYQHGVHHVNDAVQSGAAQVGFLLRAASVDHIADSAHSGRRMPPKTTFFHPKPRTGMVYRQIAG